MVTTCTVAQAGARTGWSARMLRYLEQLELVVPSRTPAGHRRYGPRELDRLRSLAELRRRHAVELGELAFAVRLRRDPVLCAAVDRWTAGHARAVSPDWVAWEQHKHERLLAA